MTKFKSNIEFLGLNYKKEIRNIIFILLILVILVVFSIFFLKELILKISLIVGSIVILYLYISRYSSMKNKLLKERIDEFIIVISYFEIFIKNKFNVYNSIQSLVPYCSNWMSDQINQLLKNIDEDKSVEPFVKFGKVFDNPLIENVCVSIFQMVEEGENTHGLTQFSLLFQEINKKHQEEKLTSKINSLESMNTYPLIGSAGITILLTAGILSIIGDLINVI